MALWDKDPVIQGNNKPATLNLWAQDPVLKVKSSKAPSSFTGIPTPPKFSPIKKNTFKDLVYKGPPREKTFLDNHKKK